MTTSKRAFGIGLSLLVLPAVAPSACASADESDSVFAAPKDAGKDVDAAKDAKPDQGSGGTDAGKVDSGTGGNGATGGTSGGTCNTTTCPTPAAPAVKCCVTSNGPCGVDYKQGAGCQMPSSGDI